MIGSSGASAGVPSVGSQVAAVIDYYKKTRWDYKHLWRSERTLSMHFGYFDESVHGHHASLLKMNAVLAGIARIAAADTVLDAGCGIGGSSIWLAAHIGCRVVGVNVTPHQIAVARAAAERAGLLTLVRFEIADFARTGLQSGTFTVVWALESLVHAESREDFLAEAFHLLAPGGRLLIAEYLLRAERPPTDADQKLVETWLDGWAMSRLLTAAQYAVLLEKAGFEHLETTDITAHVAPSLARIERVARCVRPIVVPLHKLRFLTAGQLGNARASYAQVRALRRGLWRYQVILARRPLVRS